MAKQLWLQTDLFAASTPAAVMSEAERQKAITLLRTVDGGIEATDQQPGERQ